MKALRHTALTLALLLAACAQPEAPIPGAGLHDEAWVLLALSGAPTPPGSPNVLDGSRDLTLRFDGGRVFGYDGCNTFGGVYTVSEEALSVAELDGTARACNAEVAAQAEAYLRALEQVRAYRRDGHRLELQDRAGRTRLIFTEAIKR